jgi:hypothetical protein
MKPEVQLHYFYRSIKYTTFHDPTLYSTIIATTSQVRMTFVIILSTVKIAV